MMEVVATWLRVPMEIMFFVGMAGSVIVLLLSIVDDIETLTGNDE